MTEQTKEFSRRTVLRGAGTVGISAFAVATLAACTTGAGASLSKTGPISGSFTYWYQPADPSIKSQEQWKQWNVDAFEKLYPKVTVNAIVENGNTVDAKQKVALAAGSGPDLVITPGSSDAIPYGTAGYLADLGAASKASHWQERLLPWALSMGYIDGKLEALPTSYETLCLFYNKTLFEKHGWKPPTSRASLESLAADMQSKDIIPFASGTGTFQGITEWYVSMIFNQYAGPKKVHDAIAGKLKWTDKAFVDSIKLLKNYFDKGYFQGGLKQYFSTQDPQKYSMFAEGKSAMMLSGSWEMAVFPSYFGAGDNKAEWDWAPLPPLAPGVPTDVFPLSVGGTMSVNAHSKNIRAATAYVEWLFSDTKNMWGAAVATGSEPLPIKYSPSDVPSGVDPRYKAQYQAINDASVAGRVGYVSWTSFGSSADAAILNNINQVVNGSTTPEAFCAAVQAGYDTDKKAGLIPPLFPTKS